jgi:hypothetical protein
MSDKDVLVRMIANHMKKTYVAWNQKSVNDAIIIHDLNKISHGKMQLSEETKLMHVAVAAPQVANANNRKYSNKPKGGTANNKNTITIRIVNVSNYGCI